MENKWKTFYPIIILFLILTVLFIAGGQLLTDWGVNQWVLVVGNAILFIATLLSGLVLLNSLKAKTGPAAVRGIYGSFMVKFFICVLGAFIYIMVAKKNVNKPALIACMGIYLLYTFLEVSALSKLANRKKNA